VAFVRRSIDLVQQADTPENGDLSPTGRP
jgi:hypothetical protein